MAESIDAIDSDSQAIQPLSESSEATEATGRDSASAEALGTFVVSKRGLMLALVLLVVAAFANSLSGDFIHDDLKQIQGNPLLGHWDFATISRPFKYDHWAVLRPEQAGDKVDSYYYRPMFGLSLMMGYIVAGRSPVRWHLLVMLLHAAAAILVFLVLEKSLQSVTKMDHKHRLLLAALAAGLYAAHPAQSESVAWISGLVNPLAAVFLLGSFYFYLNYRERAEKRASRMAAAIGLFALAALTKESTLILVLLVAAYELFIFNRDAGFLKRARLAATQAAPYALVAIGYMALRYAVLHLISGRNQNANFPDDAVLTTADNLRTLPALLMGYLKIAFVPFNLSFMYDFGYVRSLSVSAFWMPLVIVAAATAVLIYLCRRMPEMRLAAIWISLPLLPHLSTLAFASEELIHDRYLYLPLAGIALLIAVLIARADQEPSLRLSGRAVALASGLVLVILCAGTFAQNKTWQSEDALWSNAASHAPNSRLVHIALGYRAEVRGDLEGALHEYETALRINPDIIDALNNAAFVNARLGRWNEASQYFERIVSLTPNKAVAHFNLSFAYAVQKRYGDAVREQRAAIDLDPNGSRAGEWRARLAQLETTVASTQKVSDKK